MARKILKLDIPDPHLTKELKEFCLQYDNKMKYIRKNGCSIRGCRFKEEVDMIESALREATKDCECNYDALKKNVTQDIPVKSLQLFCGVNQFTSLRKKFYNIIIREKYGTT